MERLKNAIFWAVLVSETGHVFCCVLPVIVSILSILSGLGLLSVMPAGLLAFHDFMHEWEIPIIVASAIILALGWGLHGLSLKLDCHSTGCQHGACTPKKGKTGRLLWIATGLFVINLTIYLALHRGHDITATTVHATHEHEHQHERHQ